MGSRRIGALVDQRVRTWTKRNELRKLATRKIPVRPVITISRQYGSEGEKIGEMVSERMGFEFWDRRFVDEIARQNHLGVQLIEALDEHHRGSLEILAAGLWNAHPATSEYVQYLHHVERSLVSHGSAVLIGRGAQFVAKSEQALHVRIVAPRATRVKNLVRWRSLTPAQAEKEIDRVDADRREFIRHEFGHDVRCNDAYDILVNTAALTLEAVGGLIVSAYEAKFGSRACL